MRTILLILFLTLSRCALAQPTPHRAPVDCKAWPWIATALAAHPTYSAVCCAMSDGQVIPVIGEHVPANCDVVAAQWEYKTPGPVWPK